MKKITAYFAVVLTMAMLLSMLAGCRNASTPTGTLTGVEPTATLPSTAAPTMPAVTTQPTVPTEPVQPTEPENVFPEELRSNVYLGWKDSGFCKEMTGKVMVTVIFLSDTVSKWDEAAINATKASINKDLPKFRQQATQYGAEVDVQVTYLESKIGLAYDESDTRLMWAMYALMELGLNRATMNAEYLKNYYQVDSAPVVFVLNREGRAYANTSNGSDMFEFVLMYSSEPKAICHELCHVFGAVDFYLPEETTKAAEEHLSNSIMLDCIDGVIDGFTAHLIGWTETLTPEAEAFMRATNHITMEDLKAAHQADRITGHGTKQFDNFLYTGYMVLGVPHGEGTAQWKNGNVYTGNWDNGMRTGYGEMTYANGKSYKGEWKDGLYHGEGTVAYASGDSYTGEWVTGVMQGKGKYVWAAGEVYEGDWKGNLQHGQGTVTWTDGSTYTGAWDTGNRTGHGVMQYASGDRYEGEFQNNKRHGQGTLYYADGTSITGTWENDELKEETQA